MIKKKRQNSKTKKMLRIKKTFLVGGGDNEESVLNKKII